MAGIQMNRLTGGTLYSGGNTLLGKLEEIQLPAIKAKTTEAKALGMMVTINLPSGGFDGLTGKAKFNSVYPELIEEFGDPFTAKRVQYRGNLETHDSGGKLSEVSVVAYMTIRFKDVLPAITLKQHENPEQESDFDCTYYRLEIDGVRMVEIDAFTNTFFVKDRDVLLAYRINLGF